MHGLGAFLEKHQTWESDIYILFQFEKASEIKQIDIGNEGSAFIEVLVGKSSASDNDFEVDMQGVT